jgi:hypothetical protein
VSRAGSVHTHAPGFVRVALDVGSTFVLLDVMLMSRGESRPLAEPLTEAAAFAFALPGECRITPIESPRLELYRAGDRADYIELRGSHAAKG